MSDVVQRVLEKPNLVHSGRMEWDPAHILMLHSIWVM